MNPPRIARRILARLIPAHMREAFLDDLDEGFLRVARTRGSSAAKRWYWMQAVRGVPTLVAMRRRESETADSSWSTGHLGVGCRQAWRRLIATPGATTSAVITLTCAFAAWCAVFTVVFGVLLRPLPYAAADRLVDVGFRTPGIGAPRAGQSQGGWSLLRERAKSFDAIGIYNTNSVSLTDTGKDPEQVDISMAAPEVFDVLGVSPLIGPGLIRDVADGPIGLVISHQLWTRRYGADPEIVGKAIEMNGRVRIVRGVMPRGFNFPTAAVDIWMREDYAPTNQHFGGLNYGSVARLRAGVSAEQAEAEVNALIPRLPEIYSDVRPSWIADAKLSARVESLKPAMVGEAGPSLWLILASASLVLALAGANVANLWVIRAAQRRREIGICRAIGASGAQVFLIFLVESLIVTGVAATAAYGVAGTFLAWVSANASAFLPRAEMVGIGGARVASLLVLTAVVAVVLALVGFLTTRRGGLGDSTRGSTVSRARARTRAALTAAQVALAFALVCASSLLVRSFLKLADAPLGFDKANVLTLRVALPYTGYETFAKSVAFNHAFEERLRELSGVESVGSAASVPLARNSSTPFLESLVFIDRDGAPRLEASNVNWRLATPGYFKTMRIPVKAGHWFEPGDHFDDTFPLVVSESFAARYLGPEPLGRHIQHRANPHPWTVVGVVGDVRDDGLREGPAESVYAPVLDQDKGAPYGPGQMTFVIRSTRAADLVPDVRRVLRGLDPKLPATDVRLMDSVVAEAQGRDRLVLALVGTFAALAVLVGLVGVYGSLTYSIAERRRELGVRLALGATGRQLGARIAKDAVAVISAGVCAGALIALGLSGFLTASLFEIAPRDPLAWSAAGISLTVVAFLAIALSLRRLSGISALEAMQVD